MTDEERREEVEANAVSDAAVRRAILEEMAPSEMRRLERAETALKRIEKIFKGLYGYEDAAGQGYFLIKDVVRRWRRGEQKPGALKDAPTGAAVSGGVEGK